jgi:hypothetical protein
MQESYSWRSYYTYNYAFLTIGDSSCAQNSTHKDTVRQSKRYQNILGAGGHGSSNGVPD